MPLLTGCSKTPGMGLGAGLPRFDEDPMGVSGCFSGCLSSYLLRFSATVCGMGEVYISFPYSYLGRLCATFCNGLQQPDFSTLNRLVVGSMPTASTIFLHIIKN